MKIKVMLMSRESGVMETVEAEIMFILANENEYILCHNSDGSTKAVRNGEIFDIKLISALNGAVVRETETKNIIDLIGSRPKNINISF